MKPNEVFVIRKAIIAASGQVLRTRLPDNYYEMEEEDLDNFIYNHVTDTFEDWPIDDIWDIIDDSANFLLNFYRSL